MRCLSIDLLQTTLKNTELLNSVANLTDLKLGITRELNTSKGTCVHFI